MKKFKKVFCLIMVFMICVTGFNFSNVSTASAASYDYNYTKTLSGKTAYNLNMRKGPSTKYSKVTLIPGGTKISISGYASVNGPDWYRVKYNGKTGYVSSEYVKGIETYRFSHKDINTPTTLNIGNDFNIYGKIASNYSFKHIKVGIKNSNGYYMDGFTFNIYPSKTTYSYNLSNLNSKLAFNKLKAGSYTYTVYGKNSKNKTCTFVSKKFTVNDPNASDIYISNVSKPFGNYQEGKYFTFTGNITSRYKMVEVNIGVFDEDNNFVEDCFKTIYPEDYSYNIKNIDTELKFNKLKKGDYTYKVTAKDEKGYYETLVSSKFTIGKYNVDLSVFPTSYQNELKKLLEKHPNWTFEAVQTGINWNDAIKGEMKYVGNQLVEPYSPSSWKSKEPGAITSSGYYKTFDGRWNAASKEIVKYYMDPRNFLNEEGIYQFMPQTFDADYQTKNTVKATIKDSFMSKNSNYVNWIYNAGKKSNVNPNVLVSMIIMEQGWCKDGNVPRLISGKGITVNGTTKYKNVYNFFNIGAYTTSSMSSTHRGLWYASGCDGKDVSTSRPWNTQEKSIAGGVSFYYNNYIKKNQDTFYTKKFNVMNGKSNLGTHEYCTNVTAAYNEGRLLKNGYVNNSNLPLHFKIPVYKNMPTSKCPKV